MMQIPLSLRRISVFGKFPFMRLQQVLDRPALIVHLILKRFFYRYTCVHYDRCYQKYIFLNPQETLEKLCLNHMSLSRFGDGEFEQICGAGEYPPDSDWSQRNSQFLRDDLLKVLSLKSDRLLVAVPPKYSYLSKENAESGRRIPLLMRINVRRLMWKYLHECIEYGDSHLFVPYDSPDLNWDYLRKYFGQYDVIIATGNIQSLQQFKLGRSTYFVECGKDDAYARKDLIKKDIREAFRVNGLNPLKTIVLASLGPTATILAYEFLDEGIRLWDTGHMFKYAAQKLESK